MAELRFSDGVIINTSGELRVTQKRDGLYVIGEGMMWAVDTYEEGQRDIAKIKERRANRGNQAIPGATAAGK